MIKTFAALIFAAVVSACTVVPIGLPPEGSTADINVSSRTITRRPNGAVTEVTETTLRSSITVRNTPPRYRRDGPYRGQTVMGCNRVGDVWQYIETGYAPPQLCRYMTATDPRRRSSYRARNGHCYTVMEFGVGLFRYFTAIPGGRC